MATFNDLKCDWSMLSQDTDRWTHSDLQLAAELGKTLLERNKELENSLKEHQTTIEEQAQEIEHMKKGTAALRDVNYHRLKIYEQLEVSIQDLERANRRLVVENSSDKKLIKSQSLTIENLETKCEELQKKIDDLKSRCDNLQRQQATQTTHNEPQSLATWKASVSPDGSIHQIAARSPSKPSGDASAEICTRQMATGVADDEEVTELLRQLHESRNQRAREQKRVAELTEQLATLFQENTALEEQLSVWRNKAQDMKNLQDEINTLEEVRQGHLCGRCLRGIDLSTHDVLSVMLDQEEDDDISMADSFVNDTVRERDDDSTSIKETSSKADDLDDTDSNPYRVLVEKYEALLEVQRHPAIRRKPSLPTACMSLQEELEMSGEFNSFQNPPSECDHPQDNNVKTTNGNGGRRGFSKKPFSATPTDFSEAETSSSGFSDETSNKATQTDGRPGSFLCSIADGEDCKFSIYDDNSPFESRFRKTPEYRQIFSQIFSVLKRAAEAKDEGEKLPLLDSTANASVTRVQPDSPQDDINSEATDDCQSVMSSVISSVVSEPVFRVHTPTPPDHKSNDQESSPRQQNSNNKNSDTSSSLIGNGKNADNHPRQNQPRRHHLDYLSINVQMRKKNSAKKSSAKKLTYNEHQQRPTTPDILPTANPKITVAKSNSGGRRKFRPLTSAEQADGAVWNGNTLHVFSSKTRISPNTSSRSRHSTGSYTRNTSSDQHNTSFEYKEYKPSTASEEVARLRRLEMSYAEALRMPNKPKVHNNRRN